MGLYYTNLLPSRIPETEFPQPYLPQGWVPSKEVNEVTRLEVERLNDLTRLGCSSTPRLLDFERKIQDHNMWLPGGYVVYILMELLPGRPIYDFWALPRKERDDIRAAFRIALE